MTFGEPFRAYYLDEALTTVTTDELSLGKESSAVAIESVV